MFCTRPLRRALLLPLAVTALTGCGAIFPRYTALVRPVPAGMVENGALTLPTDGVQRIAFLEAEVAPHRADGSNWDPDGPPDLYAVLYRNGTEVYRTPVIRDGLHPTWSAAGVDVFVTPDSRLRVELWDEDGPFDDIVGRQEFLGVPTEALHGGEWLVRLEGGATLRLSATPPAPMLGLGVTYSVHDDFLGVLDVVPEGPAARAGLLLGDHITAIEGRAVSDLGEEGSREAMDRGAVRGLDFTVVRGSQGVIQVHTRLDAVYPAQ